MLGSANTLYVNIHGHICILYISILFLSLKIGFEFNYPGYSLSLLFPPVSVRQKVMKKCLQLTVS